jgi:hypothetical protein
MPDLVTRAPHRGREEGNGGEHRRSGVVAPDGAGDRRRWWGAAASRSRARSRAARQPHAERPSTTEAEAQPIPTDQLIVMVIVRLLVRWMASPATVGGPPVRVAGGPSPMGQRHRRSGGSGARPHRVLPPTSPCASGPTGRRGEPSGATRRADRRSAQAAPMRTPVPRLRRALRVGRRAGRLWDTCRGGLRRGGAAGAAPLLRPAAARPRRGRHRA